jgi:hypothetical protein
MSENLRTHRLIEDKKIESNQSLPDKHVNLTLPNELSNEDRFEIINLSDIYLSQSFQKRVAQIQAQTAQKIQILPIKKDIIQKQILENPVPAKANSNSVAKPIGEIINKTFNFVSNFASSFQPSTQDEQNEYFTDILEERPKQKEIPSKKTSDDESPNKPKIENPQNNDNLNTVLQITIEVQSIVDISKLANQEVIAVLEPLKQDLDYGINEIQTGLSKVIQKSKESSNHVTLSLKDTQSIIASSYHKLEYITNHTNSIHNDYLNVQAYLNSRLADYSKKLNELESSNLNLNDQKVLKECITYINQTKKQNLIENEQISGELAKHNKLTSITGSVLDRSQAQLDSLNYKSNEIATTSMAQQDILKKQAQLATQNLQRENTSVDNFTISLKEISDLLDIANDKVEFEKLAKTISESKQLVDVTKENIQSELKNWRKELNTSSQLLEVYNSQNTLIVEELKLQKTLILNEINKLENSLNNLDKTFAKLKAQAKEKASTLNITKNDLDKILNSTANNLPENNQILKLIKPENKTQATENKGFNFFNLFSAQNPLVLFGSLSALMVSLHAVKDYNLFHNKINNTGNVLEKQVVEINKSEKNLVVLQHELKTLQKLNQNYKSDKIKEELLENATKIVNFLTSVGLAVGSIGIGSVILVQSRETKKREKLIEQLASYLSELKSTNVVNNIETLSNTVVKDLLNVVEQNNSPETFDLIDFLRSSPNLQSDQEVSKLDNIIQQTLKNIVKNSKYDTSKSLSLLSSLALSLATLSTFNSSFANYINQKINLANNQIQITQSEIEKTSNQIQKQINYLANQKSDLEKKLKSLNADGINMSSLLKLKKRAELEILIKKLESEMVAFKTSLETKVKVGVSPVLEIIQEQKNNLSQNPDAQYLALLSSLILSTRVLGKILESQRQSEIKKTLEKTNPLHQDPNPNQTFTGNLKGFGKNTPVKEKAKTSDKGKSSSNKTESGGGGGKNKPPQKPRTGGNDDRFEDEAKRQKKLKEEQLELERKYNLVSNLLKNHTNIIEDGSKFNDNAFEIKITPQEWFSIKLLIDLQVSYLEKKLEGKTGNDIARLRLLKGIQIFIDTNYNEILFENRHKNSHFILLNLVASVLFERDEYKKNFYEKGYILRDNQNEIVKLFKPIDQSFRVTMQKENNDICTNLEFLSSLTLVQFMRCICANKGKIHVTNFGLTNKKSIHLKDMDMHVAVGLDNTGLGILEAFERTIQNDNLAKMNIEFLVYQLPVKDMSDSQIEKLVSDIPGNYYRELERFFKQVVPEMLKVESIMKDRDTIKQKYDTEYFKWLNSSKVQEYFLMECEQKIIDKLFISQSQTSSSLDKVIQLIDFKIANPESEQVVKMIQDILEENVQNINFLNKNSWQELKNNILLVQLENETAEQERLQFTKVTNLTQIEIPREKVVEELNPEKQTLVEKLFPKELYSTAGARIEESIINKQSVQKNIQIANNLFQKAVEIYNTKAKQVAGGLTETIILLAKNPSALGQSPIITPNRVEYFREGSIKANIPPGVVEVRLGNAERMFVGEKNGELVLYAVVFPAYHGGQTIR